MRSSIEYVPFNTEVVRDRWAGHVTDFNRASQSHVKSMSRVRESYPGPWCYKA